MNIKKNKCVLILAFFMFTATINQLDSQCLAEVPVKHPVLAQVIKKNAIVKPKADDKIIIVKSVENKISIKPKSNTVGVAKTSVSSKPAPVLRSSYSANKAVIDNNHRNNPDIVLRNAKKLPLGEKKVVQVSNNQNLPKKVQVVTLKPAITVNNPKPLNNTLKTVESSKNSLNKVNLVETNTITKSISVSKPLVTVKKEAVNSQKALVNTSLTLKSDKKPIIVQKNVVVNKAVQEAEEKKVSVKDSNQSLTLKTQKLTPASPNINPALLYQPKLMNESVLPTLTLPNVSTFENTILAKSNPTVSRPIVESKAVCPAKQQVLNPTPRTVQKSAVKNSPQVNNQAVTIQDCLRLYNNSYSETFMAVMSALSINKISIDSFDTAKGFVNATSLKKKQLYIIVLPSSENQTYVRITPADGVYNLNLALIKEVFLAVNNELALIKHNVKK